MMRYCCFVFVTLSFFVAKRNVETMFLKKDKLTNLIRSITHISQNRKLYGRIQLLLSVSLRVDGPQSFLEVLNLFNDFPTF